MFNKSLIAAFVALAAAAGTQARLVAPGQIPKVYSADAPVDPSTQVTYSVKLAAAGQSALDAKMAEIAQTDGDWLSDEQLQGYTHASDSHIAAVKAHLVKFGGQKITLNKWGDSITVSHSAQQANAAWGANLTHFTHAPSGNKIVRTSQYTVPDALHEAVLNVHPFTAFGNLQRSAPVQQMKRQWGSGSDSGWGSDSGSGSGGSGGGAQGCNDDAISISCIKSQYQSSDYQPKPQDNVVDTLVMGYIGQYVSQSDLSAFLKEQVPDQASYKINIETAGGGTNDPSQPGDESMLDVEMVSGITAPLHTTFLSYGPADTQSDDFFADSLNYVLNQGTKPGVITISYGEDESAFSQGDAQSICTAAQKLTAQGTTVVVASGDNGVNANQAQSGESCDQHFNPTYPSGCPYVLSVGATQGTSPEVPTDGSAQSGFWSGAGFSNVFSAPSYQASVVKSYVNSIGSLDSGKYNKNGRAFPDLAALGLNIQIHYQGQDTTVGGTSAAAPIVASHIALLNNYRQQNGKGRVGWFQPKLYGNPSALSDITSGKTGGCFEDNTLYFPAKKGWDPASGLGTPLFKAWQNL